MGQPTIPILPFLNLLLALEGKNFKEGKILCLVSSPWGVNTMDQIERHSSFTLKPQWCFLCEEASEDQGQLLWQYQPSCCMWDHIFEALRVSLGRYLFNLLLTLVGRYFKEDQILFLVSSAWGVNIMDLI